MTGGMTSSRGEVVALRHGCMVRVTALKILLRLEELGCKITLVAGRFAFTPAPGMKSLTKRQSDAIVTHKRDLTRLVRYVLEERYEGSER